MNDAVENLLPYERDLFFALNGSDSTYLDKLMWTITGRWIWIPVVLLLLFTIFRRKPVFQSLLILIAIVILFTLCDQIASSFFKPYFHRFRPTHHPDFQNMVDTVNGFTSGLYGFISSHAANSFGLATFLTLLFRNKLTAAAFFLWAVLNSYSRIYLGVHFLSDIIVGAIVGTLVAFAVYYLWKYVHQKIFKSNPYIYSQKDTRLLAIGIFTYLIIIAAFAPCLSQIHH